ncbi:MAG: hypothetical protein ACPLN1_06525 [Caldisericia bacterium]
MFYPYFRRGFNPKCKDFGYKFHRGYGYRNFFKDDKTHLEFAKKELELRLEYLSKELEVDPDDPELKFAKREVENRIAYIEDLLNKVVK